jgi:hypothetical protein
VPTPDWDLGDDGAEYTDENQVGFQPLVDENGNPLPNQPVDTYPQPQEGPPQQPSGQVDQQWLDQVLPQNGQQRPGQPSARQPQPQPQIVRPPQPQVVRPPQPRSAPTDPLQPAPEPPQQ